MITEKPDINEVYLIHVGVKGMRWGRRKARSDEADRAKVFSKSNAKKAAKGVAVLAGVALVAAVMTKSGRTKMVDVATSTYVKNRSAKNVAKANPVNDLVRRFSAVKVSSVPTPAQMMANAREAAVRTEFDRQGAQRLTEQVWRNQARISQLSRGLDDTTNSLLSGTAANLARAAGGR